MDEVYVPCPFQNPSRRTRKRVYTSYVYVKFVKEIFVFVFSERNPQICMSSRTHRAWVCHVQGYSRTLSNLLGELQRRSCAKGAWEPFTESPAWLQGVGGSVWGVLKDSSRPLILTVFFQGLAIKKSFCCEAVSKNIGLHYLSLMLCLQYFESK